MQRSLLFVEGLRLSIELLMQPIALLGNKGSGKTYAGLKLFEQAHGAGVQCIWFDPVAKAYGLRLGADGRTVGGLTNVYIFGGKRGDFPLAANQGAFIAKLLVEKRVSCVFDLSQFRKSARKQFITEFLEEFYHLKVDADDGLPTLMFFEEAHLVLPQKPMRGDERMLGAVEDVVLLGRNCGIGTVLMDQRPAHVNKSCLAETEVLLALRTTYPLDRAVYKAWIADKGAQEIDLDAELPELEAGQGFLWAPTSKIFKRVRVLPRETYDSSATARIGGRRKKTGRLTAVDASAISGAMKTVTAAATANDPTRLRARVAELEGKLAAVEVQAANNANVRAANARLAAAAKTPAVDKRALRRFERATKTVVQLERESVGLVARVKELGSDFAKASVELEDAVDKLHAASSLPGRDEWKTKTFGKHYAADSQRVFGELMKNGNNAMMQVKPSAYQREATGKLGKGERAVMTAIAQTGTVGAGRDQLSVVTGYKRSTRDAYVLRLLQAKYVEELPLGDIVATKAGLAWLGDFQPLPTGDALREHWLRTLPSGESRILAELAKVFPSTLERSTIDQLTGFKRSTRDAYIFRLVKRRLVTEHSNGGIVAVAELFS